MRRFVHNPVTTRIYNVLEKLNIDFKGPFRTKTIHGETGFFLFVDQLSGYLRPYLIRQNNSATLLFFKRLFIQLEQNGRFYKVISTVYLFQK